MEDQDQPDVDLDMTDAMRKIYTSCDVELKNSVPVSRLIEYITPFMQANMSDLLELKTALDPNDKDPEISGEKFYKVMAEWTRKFNDCSNSFHSISAGNLGIIDDKALPFVQSTPRASFGNRLIKGSVEACILNASILSNQSYVDNGPGIAALEKSYYEDQINELTHQNRKYSDELLHIKLQLMNTEEQNEILQADLEKLKKQLLHEHEVIEELQKERMDCDELREASINAQKQTERAQKNLQLVEKENLQLKQQISKLELEKQKTEEKMTNMHKNVNEKVNMLIELQTEIKVKDVDLIHLEDVKNKLLQKLNEQQKIIDDYQESTRCMQVEKEKLQKILHERMKKQTKASVKHSLSFSEYNTQRTLHTTQPPNPPPKATHLDQEKDVPFTSAIKTEVFNFFNFDSPVARMRRRSAQHPLSPLAKSNHEQHLENSHDPICSSDQIRNVLSTKEKITNKSEYSSMTRSILDNSLPNDVNSSILEPVRVFMSGSTNPENTTLCTDLVPYDYFQTPKGDEYAESPPTMYVVERSNSPHRTLKADPILTSPNVSTFSINDSSDEEFFMRLQTSNTNSYSPHESLKSEISKVATQDNVDVLKTMDYESRISNLEYELKQHQLDNNRLSFEKIKLENDMYLSRIKQLTTDNEFIHKQVTDLKEQLTLLKSEKDELENMKNNFIQTSADEIDKLRLEFESKIKTLADENKKNQNNFDNLMVEKNLLEEKTKEYYNIKENLDEFKNKNLEFNRIIEDLQQENHVLFQNIHNLKEENANLIEENHTLDVTLREKIDALNEKEIQFESETNGLQEQVESVKSAYDSLKENLARIEHNNLEEIRVLQRKIAELLEEREGIENEYLNDKNVLEKQHLDLKHEITSMREKIVSLESELLKKDMVVKSLNEENLESLKQQKDKENARINSEIWFKQIIDQLESKICAMKEEKAACDEHNLNIQTSLNKLQKEIDKIQLEKNNMKPIEDFMKLEESLATTKKENKQLHQKLKTIEDKPKRVNHDKMQMKLEKQLEKVDYLEEQLHKERREKLDLEEKIKEIDEKYVTDTNQTNLELSESRRYLKRSSQIFLQKWRHQLDKISSMDDILDQIDNGDSPRLYRGLERPLDKELCLLKTEIKLIVNVMENLANISFTNNTTNENQVTFVSSIDSFSGPQKPSKFLLKPPTLVIRPMSPDSPNLEINQPKYESPPIAQKSGMSPDSGGDIVTSCIGAGDISTESFNSGSITINEFKISESDSPDTSISLYEDAVDGLFPSSLIKLDYFSEDYKMKNATEEELEEMFMAFVLGFTMESGSIKKRLESHYAQVKQTEMNLSATMKGIVSIVKTSLVGQSIQEGEILVKNLVDAVCKLCQLVEQFGALKHENKLISSISMMINYTSSLNIKLEAATQSLCRFTSQHIETVSIESNIGNGKGISPIFSRGVFWSVLSTMMVMSMIFYLFIYWSLEQQRDGYSLKYLTWDDIFKGFVKKEYRDGPPPI